jgi:GcrA cell cycle regulator
MKGEGVGNGVNVEWSDAAMAFLRSLWDEGHSTAEIGRRMGRTKSGIIGKAHRLDLPGRPSPIRAAGSGARPGQHPVRSRRAGPITLPALPRWCTHCFRILTAEQTRFCSSDCYRLAAVPRRTPKPPAPRAPRPESTPASVGHVTECCFPLNDGRPWRFCCEPTEPGKPYCAKHWAATHIPLRDRRDAADLLVMNESAA